MAATSVIVKTEDYEQQKKEEETKVSNEVPSELERKIIAQIEYYFGDVNLTKDKFLKEEAGKDDGWIPLSILLTFKRLKTLSEDPKEIITALRKSSSNLIEIGDCESKIRRNVNKPLPELNDEYHEKLKKRTIHAKGFPENSQLEDLMTFCEKFGPVESIEMRRRFKSRAFKGCIFVIFANEEAANEMLNQEVSYNENLLLRENKIAYLERKKKYHENMLLKKQQKTNGSESNSDIKQEEKASEEEKSEEQSKNENKEEEAEEVNVLVKGAILKLSDVPKSTPFHVIKTFLSPYGTIRYVDNVNEHLEVFIRFAEEGEAQAVFEKVRGQDSDNETKIDFGSFVASAEVLSGEEEKKYWVYCNAIRKNYRENFVKGKKKRHNRSAYVSKTKTPVKRAADTPVPVPVSEGSAEETKRAKIEQE